MGRAHVEAKERAYTNAKGEPTLAQSKGRILTRVEERTLTRIGPHSVRRPHVEVKGAC
jgi:hypothetical protein